MSVAKAFSRILPRIPDLTGPTGPGNLRAYEVDTRGLECVQLSSRNGFV